MLFQFILREERNARVKGSQLKTEKGLDSPFSQILCFTNAVGSHCLYNKPNMPHIQDDDPTYKANSLNGLQRLLISISVFDETRKGCMPTFVCTILNFQLISSGCDVKNCEIKT